MQTYDDILKISYSERDFSGARYAWEIDLIKQKETEISRDGINEKEIIISKAKNKIKKLCNILDKWKEQYVNNMIIDGCEYIFVVEFADKRCKKVYCKNKVPEGFAEFLETMEADIYG